MKFEGDTVICRSASPFFEFERDGSKPNTVRVVKTDELLTLGRCRRIRIVHVDGGPAADMQFEREISAVFDISPAIKAMRIRGTYNTFWVSICWDPFTAE